MPKCPDCNKFAGYDEPQVEINDSSIDDGGTVTIDGRMVLNSACCGSELKEWNFSLSGDADLSEHKLKGKHELEVEADDGEAEDYYDNPGRPSRYRRHIYKIRVPYVVKCVCGFTVSGELSDEERASGFDELN